MPNQIFSATLGVKVNGVPLPADVEPLLTFGLVETTTAVPAMFELHFSDVGRVVVSRAGLKIGAPVELAVATNEPGTTVLLKGEIATLEADIGPTGVLTIVRGYDTSYRLTRTRRAEAYQDSTAQEICQKIAQAHGLTFSGVSSPRRKHVLQAGQSDWTFLHRLAQIDGLSLTCTDGTLVLARPTAVSAATGQATARSNPLVLQVGANLLWLRSSVTGSDQVKNVEVRGWDPMAKQPVVGTAAAATTGVRLGQAAPAAIANELRSGDLLVSSPELTTSDEATARARGLGDAVGGAFAELDGAVTGNPALRAGKVVALVGLGEPFDGAYTLTRVQHRFEPAGAGYTTQVQVSAAANRTTAGVVAGAGGGGAGGGSAGGGAGRGGGHQVLVGVVTNVKDPDKLGRVKVKLPTLSDQTETWWAPVVMPGAGNERGFMMVPAVNDLVLVALPDSPVAAPWVLGGLHNGKDLPPLEEEDIEPGTAAWVSRSGFGLQLVEKEGKEGIVLSLSWQDASKDSITIAKSADKGITITSSGPVAITAEKDVTVKTTTGAVTIEGATISLKGTQKVSITAPQVELKADAAAEISGATVKVAGQATAEISSSGITTVRGSLVKIN